jgi:branched-chain amino acid transport system ATP-binding protein
VTSAAVDTPIVLQTDGLSVGYNKIAIARDLQIQVRAGEVVALLGRNGAGKTTTLNTIAGILPVIDGQVLFEGQPASGSLHRRARRGVALVTEDRAVIRRLTVSENLRLGQGDPERGLDLFPELKSMVKRPAGLLSGGEQQMLVLARVLAAEPRLLLVDELSFGLAPLIVKRLLAALRRAADDSGTGILLVEQHPLTALEISDRGYVLAQGRIAIDGAAAELKDRLGEIEQTYLSHISPVATA